MPNDTLTLEEAAASPDAPDVLSLEEAQPLPPPSLPPQIRYEPLTPDDDYVSHPALPLPLRPLPPITGERLTVPPPPGPGLFDRFNQTIRSFYEAPTSPTPGVPVQTWTPEQLRTVEEVENRLRLKERIERVESPSIGLRESAAEGVKAVASPAGVATIAAVTAAPEIAIPALFTKTLFEVPEVIEEVQRARESGNRADYYRAVGNALQTGLVLAGTFPTTVRLPRTLDAWRESVAERAEARFQAAKDITPKPAKQLVERIEEPPNALQKESPLTGFSQPATIERAATRDPNQLQTGTQTQPGSYPQVESKLSEAYIRSELDKSVEWLQALERDSLQARVDAEKKLLGTPLEGEAKAYELLGSSYYGGAEVRTPNRHGEIVGTETETEGIRPSQEPRRTGQQTGELEPSITGIPFEMSPHTQQVVEALQKLRELPSPEVQASVSRTLLRLLSEKVSSQEKAAAIHLIKSYASENISSAEIHGSLRPQPVEGERQMPPEIGSERVQPRPEEKAGEVLLTPEEQSRTGPTADPFERARAGEESAFDDLDAQFREIFPEPDEYAVRGRPNPHQVHTPKQFADKFNTAFAARDFQTILDTIKATSDVSIWKPFLKDLFSKQAADPIAAKKAEWFRHVFNGTVPPDAIPPKAAPPPKTPTATPPKPTAGPTPGTPPPPPPPPSPPPERIPVEPITGGGAKSPYKIIEDFEAAMKKAIRVRRLKKNQLGVYQPGSTLTAERFAGDLDTTAHELAGHWTDDRYGIGKPWIKPKTRSPYDTELAKFWIHGSVTPTSTLRYRRAEGIAEFIRAYVVNPTKAKAEAPNFAAYFERTIPPDALKAINDFGKDVRTWAGEDPLIRAGLNMRMDPPSLTERLWKGIRGRGFGFEISPIDTLRLWFDDPYHYAVKAFHEMRALRGGTLLPKDNFELQARLLATHDARMSDQFERGLTPLRPTQSLTGKGELAVDRLTDPVTKEPMTLKWLVGAFDRTDKAKMLQDMRDASAYMVAQRTVEKGAQLGRDINVSGIGAGILTDKAAAEALLSRVAADPVREARLKESARRYRLWADKNLDMLVDSGRLSPERAKEIRDNNQQYVDMHRLSMEFESGFAKQRGVKIGTSRDVIKRFKGSTLELDNVYSNLLEQTDAIQKEAFRNVVMNTFVDGLRNVRELHGPDLKDFDQFGSKATSADRNTITIYKNGKAEYWKFDPNIHESLKGLGELGTHAFIDLLSLPSRFARYMITQGPSFILRNIVRDAFERSVVSATGSKPWDIRFPKAEEKSRYEVFGGGQFGNYIVDRHAWNRELKKAMADLRKDPFNIFVAAGKLKRGWEWLSETSEKMGRLAEFRRAFEHARTKLGYDDYNAALYAAGEARGLLDFAKAGTVMRSINRLVPFSNARVRGLAKSFSSAAQNPGRFAMNWAMYVLAPTIGIMLWNRKDEETWNEYLQLPAYRRDFFWNLKFGNYWLMIPKPHLLGVLAGGVERAVIKMLGDDKAAMEGFAGDVGSAVSPLSTPVEGVGPLKSFLELYFNRDSFRGYDIVPAWEKDLKLELRKGTEHASGSGKGIANAINKAGLEVDPRQVDYMLQSYGGLGQILTDVTKRSFGETVLKGSGYLTESSGSSARDVQWVTDWARKNGKLQDRMFKPIRDLRKLSLDAKDVQTRAEYSAMMRLEATRLRKVIESMEQ